MMENHYSLLKGFLANVAWLSARWDFHQAKTLRKLCLAAIEAFFVCMCKAPFQIDWQATCQNHSPLLVHCFEFSRAFLLFILCKQQQMALARESKQKLIFQLSSPLCSGVKDISNNLELQA